MPSKAGRTLAEVRSESEKINTARAAMNTRLVELREAIAAASLSEEEGREEAITRGYPAKRDKKLRELRDEQADLQEQLETSDRLEARLDLERLELEVEELQRTRAAAVSKASRIEQEHAAVEARLNAARVEVAGTQDTERALREEIHRTRNRLARLDPAHAAQRQAEHERRSQEVQDGFTRQRAENLEKNARLAGLDTERIPSA